MAENTNIQWADNTFNPWIGCTKVSAGCKNCYAENTTRARVLRSHGHETWGRGAQRSRTSAANWKAPWRWNSECEAHPGYGNKVFPSLCDWLDNEVPIQWLVDFLELIRETPHLKWLLLTKRPENFEQRLAQASAFLHPEGNMASVWLSGDYPQNVWVGTSVEDQPNANKRIPELLNIPARVRFLSAEPLLGPIDFKHATPCGYYCGERVGHVDHSLHGIHWIIFGGESGPTARSCDLSWIKDGVNQCREAGIAAFVKQLGRAPFITGQRGIGSTDGDQYVHKFPVNHPKGGDMEEWPIDLRVRLFPRGER